MMKEIIKPPPLEPGDTIGIISPSEPMYLDGGSDLISQGVKTLESDGFNVFFAPNASKSRNYMAGTRYERASDINLLFSMPEIKALLCSRGGKSSNQLLDLLDYDLIQNNPKIILGFSDPTNILNAIQAKTGLVTFYGPQNLNHFRNVGRTLEFFHKATVYGNIGEIDSYAGEVIKSGQATGRIVGGNLSCFSLGILGTEYQPDFQNTILFWETSVYFPQRIDQLLNHYRLCGVFDKINGMVIGYLDRPESDPIYEEPNIKDLMLSVTDGYDFPIIKIDCLGHTWGKRESVTLPIGCTARMDSGKLSLEILESSVLRSSNSV